MSKKGTLEQWKELGTLSKEIQGELGHLLVLSSHMIPLADCNEIIKADNALGKWRSSAENIMFKQLGSIDNGLCIFYGPR